jgi:hypothetical protein
LLLGYFTFCSGKAILAFVFPMKSNFSKIDENIADGPYGVNRKALGPGGSRQPAAGRECPLASPSLSHLGLRPSLGRKMNDSIAL